MTDHAALLRQIRADARPYIEMVRAFNAWKPPEPEAAVSVTAGEGAFIAAALPGDASPTEPVPAACTVHGDPPTPTDAGEGQWPPALPTETEPEQSSHTVSVSHVSQIVAATATIAPVEPSVSSLLTTAPGAPPFDDMPDIPDFLRRSAA